MGRGGAGPCSAVGRSRDWAVFAQAERRFTTAIWGTELKRFRGVDTGRSGVLEGRTSTSYPQWNRTLDPRWPPGVAGAVGWPWLVFWTWRRCPGLMTIRSNIRKLERYFSGNAERMHIAHLLRRRRRSTYPGLRCGWRIRGQHVEKHRPWDRLWITLETANAVWRARSELDLRASLGQKHWGGSPFAWVRGGVGVCTPMGGVRPC